LGVATGEQLKALVQSYVEGDETRFLSLAMQIAAHEARRGHGKLAQDIKTLIDKARTVRNERTHQPVPMVEPRGELAGLLAASYPTLRLADMVLEPEIRHRLVRILDEQHARAKLRAHGLEPRRKLLLVGPPGSGKSMTAAALAGELHLPLFVIRLDSLITKFMGETAAKLRLVFDAMAATRGVYLFDEFDSIGAQRALLNEVGEIRRVLNSFLQFIEHDASDGLVLAATNHPEVLDRALHRRFDDLIQYGLPNDERILETLKSRLAAFGQVEIDWLSVVALARGRSYAEIVRACQDAAKSVLLADRDVIRTEDVIRALKDRTSVIDSSG
jgi:SpoVK/Ycf46/Vps4 family AAA+-type ATPase